MKQQVMRRATVTQVAPQIKPQQQADTIQTTKENHNNKTTKFTLITNTPDKARGAQQKNGSEIVNDRFRPQATPSVPVGKLKRSPQMTKPAHSSSSAPQKATERHLQGKPLMAKEDPSTALHRRLNNGLPETADALPVLKAFQEFLDIERKRSRRNITILTTCFAIIIILVITSGVLGGLLFMKPLKDEYTAMRETLESYKADNVESREYIQSSLMQINNDIQKERSEFTSTKDNIAHLTQTYDKTVTDLKTIIDTLNKENTNLKEDMLAMRNTIPSLSRDLNRALEEIAELRADFHPAPEQQGEYTANSYVTITVKPEGMQRNVNLRLPIAE